MSLPQSQPYETNGMFEGYGGPIRMTQFDTNGIDPTLEACCQQEVRCYAAPYTQFHKYFYLTSLTFMTHNINFK